MAEEWVTIAHEGIEGTARVTRAALQTCWKDLGWQEVSPVRHAFGVDDLNKLSTDELQNLAREQGMIVEGVSKKDLVAALETVASEFKEG